MTQVSRDLCVMQLYCLTRLSRTRLSRHLPISSLFRIPIPIYVCYFEIGYLVKQGHLVILTGSEH